MALRQSDDRLALAQGLVIGLALWGLIVNFVLHLLPGMSGALAGRVIVLSLGASACAWRRSADPARCRHARSRASVSPGSPSFWIALASRQLLIIPDHLQHTLIPATIRAGNWPPRLPWNPDLELAYHYGMDLLVGLLTPPIGPDLSFTTEVLGAYARTSLMLLVGTQLLRRGSWLGTSILTSLAACRQRLDAGVWQPAVGTSDPGPSRHPSGRAAGHTCRHLLARS